MTNAQPRTYLSGWMQELKKIAEAEGMLEKFEEENAKAKTEEKQ